MIDGDTHGAGIYVRETDLSAMPPMESDHIERSRYETLEVATEPVKVRPSVQMFQERAEERERELEILRVVRQWHRDSKRRAPLELKLILAVSAIGILMVIGGTLWGEVISGEISHAVSVSRLAQLAENALTAARMVQYGIITALVGMFASLLILARASGFKF